MSTPRAIRMARRLALRPYYPECMDTDDEPSDEPEPDAPWPEYADTHAADAAADRWQQARGL